jgi:hypothetical protein
MRRATLEETMVLRLPRRSLVLGALAGVGCYSPTLPLPPPLKPTIEPTGTDSYRITGGVTPNAVVLARNERTWLIDGQQTGSLGFYDFVLHNAQAGDAIELWYEVGTDLSPTTLFALPLGSQAAPARPPLAPGDAGGAAGSGGDGGASGSP